MPFLHSVGGHQHVVDSLAFSPDGKLLLSGSWDGTARLWDFASGELLRTFAWGSEKIQCVAWSPDGRFVAVGGESPAIQPGEEYLHWEQDAPCPLTKQATPSPPSAHLKLQPAIRVFEVESGTLFRTFDGFNLAAAFSQDGGSLAASSYDEIAVFDLADRSVRAHRPNGRHRYRQLSYSPDGRKLAALDSSGVWLFDSATLQLLGVVTDGCMFTVFELPLEIDHMLIGELRNDHCDFFPDDRPNKEFVRFAHRHLQGFPSIVLGEHRQIVVAAPDRRCYAATHEPQFPDKCDRISLIDGDSLETLRELTATNEEWIRLAAFSPDGRVLASTGDDRQITVWDVATGTAQRKFGCPAGDISAIATSLNGPLIAAADIAGRIVLIDVDSASVIATAQLPVPIAQLEFSPDDDFLIAASECNTIHELEIPSLKVRSRFDGIGQQFAGGMLFPACGGYLAVSKLETVVEEETTIEKLLTLYSWPDGQVVESLPLPNQNYVWSTARSVSDHGLGIVTDNEIFLVRMTEKIEVMSLVRHPNPFFCAVAFPWSDGRIVIANDGFGIGIVDANSATCTSHFHASRDGVTSISTSPDSRWLARSTAYWEQIEIFELPSGILKRRLIGHQAAVNEVAFLPDSRRLVSAGRDGTLKIWDVESSTCLASFAWTGNDWECLTCENVPVEIGPNDPPTSPDRS